MFKRTKMKILTISLIALCLSACSNTGNNNQTAMEKPNEPVQQKEIITPPSDISELLNKHTCLTCHAASEKVVGPAYKEVAKRNYTNEEIVELIYKPKPEHWPDYPPMVGLPKVPKDDALKIAAWINSLK